MLGKYLANPNNAVFLAHYHLFILYFRLSSSRDIEEVGAVVLFLHEALSGQEHQSRMCKPCVCTVSYAIPKKRVSAGEAYAHTATCSGEMTNGIGKL